MALKKMRVSFDLDINVFMSMLAAGNSGMHIDVFGDDKHAKQPKQLKNGHAPKLLEGPRNSRGKDSNGNRVTAYDTILAFLVANKDRGIKANELHALLEGINLSPKSAHPQLAKLRQNGFVKKNPADGLYHVTARGIAHHEKTVAAANAEA